MGIKSQTIYVIYLVAEFHEILKVNNMAFIKNVNIVIFDT